MRTRSLVLAVFWTLATSSSTRAQADTSSSTSSLTAQEQLQQNGVFVDPRPPTIEEQLHAHSIALDKSAIVKALQNSDAEVRTLAALKLANDKAVDEVPKLLAVLKRERLPEVELLISVALAELGEAKGFASLKMFCGDKAQSPTIRLGASQDLLFAFQREDCLNAVLDIAQTDSSSSTAGQALKVLSGFRDAFNKDPRKILDPMLNALSSPDPQVRISAGWALQNLRDVSVIPDLETALSREPEESVRRSIELDLQLLKHKD